MLFFAAAAAMMLASCSEKMDFTQADLQNAANSPSNEVQFGTYMGRTATTRAATLEDQDYDGGAIGNADGDFTKDLKKARFGVFSYFTGANTWATNARTIAPNFMYNQELTWSTANPANMWIYTPVKYWPNGIDAANAADDPSNTAIQNQEGKLSFFAVAPFTATPTAAYSSATDGTIPSNISSDDNVKQTSATTKGIKAMTTNASGSDVWVKYLMPNAQEDQAVDLLWGVRGQKSYAETDAENNTVAALGSEYNVDLTKQIVGEKVKFLFKHALAKIGGATATETESATGNPAKCGFKVVVDVDGNGTDAAGADNQDTYFDAGFSNTSTLVTIKEVKIRDLGSVVSDGDVTGVTTGTSNLNTFGWFNIETGTWCNEAGTVGNNGAGATYKVVANNDATLTNTTYLLNEKILETGAAKATDGTKKVVNGTTWTTPANPVGVTTTPTDLFANENVPGLMVIPGGSADIYITVDYLVRTADPNLAAGYSEVEQVITNKVSLASLESNKYYTIIMHLGLTSVKFEAVVADWVSNDGTEFDEDGHAIDPATPTANTESIWLPSNVVSASNIRLNVASDATSATVTIDGMAAGSYTSDNTTVIGNGTATAGRNNLSVTLTPNLTNQPVETVVKITDADSKVTTITITQAPDATFNLASTKISADGTTTKGTITVTPATAVTVSSVTGVQVGGTELTLSNLSEISSSTINSSGSEDISYNVTLTITGSDLKVYTYHTTIEQEH